MKNLRFPSLIATCALIFGLMSCDDSTENTSSGKATMKVTDAAVAAENVSGVFLSVNEIQAVSETETRTLINFDSPMKFNLMDYQNGETYTLGEGDLEAGTYSEVRFILSGNSYIEFLDGNTEPITIPSGTTSGYKIKGNFEIAANTTSELVADIDLRKALVVTGNGEFILKPTGRVIEETNTGVIKGTVDGSFEAGEQVVVYAYALGTYDDSESGEPIEGESRFSNSVNSAVVAEDGSYTLAFMEEGEYEIIVAHFTNEDQDDDLEFQGTVETKIFLSGTLFNSITVESNTTVSAFLQVI